MSPTFNISGLDELIWAEESIAEARYAVVAMFCLQVYEWTLGIHAEIRLIHKSSWTSIKILYLFCRYYPLCLWFLLTWAYVGNHDFETCNRYYRVVNGLIAPCQFFSQAVMLMRAFAFSGRRAHILALLGTCYVCLVGVDIWVFCVDIDLPPQIFYEIVGTTGCYPNYGSGPMGLRIGFSMLAATLMDLLSLLVVVVHCFRSRWDRDVSLARYFVNQGLSAFALVSVVNIVTAVTYFRHYHIDIGLPMIVVVSNVLACRIILQLRAQVLPATDTELSRRHGYMVQNAFSFTTDSWTMDSQR